MSYSVSSQDKQTSWSMFDRIAGRYDLLNRLLSGRRDVAWRRFLASFFPDSSDLTYLDIATGTGDVLLSVVEQLGAAKFRKIVGADLSKNMMSFGEQKVQSKGLDHLVSFDRQDAQALTFDSKTFDVVSIAFGIRNVPDVNKALRELQRVLKVGGRCLILEFSLPKNRLFREVYLLYFRYVLPFLGGLISGDREAYSYLNESVESFPYGEAFMVLMDQAQFSKVRAYPLNGGIATLYVGDKL